MLSRKIRQRGVLGACATGALALVVVSGGVANAGTACGSSTVVSGTGTVFMTKSYIANMAAHNISMVAQNPISVTTQDTYTTTIWNTSGGTVNLKACTGFVDLAGGTLVTNTATGQQLMLKDIRWDVANNTIDYTVSTPNGDATVIAMDLKGAEGGFVAGDNEVYGASALYIDPAAAATLDSYLGTTAFVDTGLFGWFATSFQTAQHERSGPVHCG